jgi:hypothetical protein
LWLDRVVRKSRVPYPVFFGLMAAFLYLLGLPFMITSGNLHSFLAEPRWVIVALFGALNGVLIVFVFRKFSDSLTGIQPLIGAEEDFQKIKDKLLAHLTRRVYWFVVGLLLALNSIESPQTMRWWWFYHQPDLITIYALIETLPCCILGGMFMYMIPIGLNLAYRDLCFNTLFQKDALVRDWMKPFKDFKWLITMTMFGAGVYAVFPPNIWGMPAGSSAAAHWVTFIPYVSIAIVLVAAILLPHIFFHRLFSKVKDSLLGGFQRETPQASMRQDKDILSKILLLLEKGETEKLKTWLLDEKIVGEILIVASILVGLVELLASIT